MNKVQSVQKTFRELGFANGLWLAVHRMLTKVTGGQAQVFRYYLVVQPVPTESVLGARASAASTVRQVGPDDPRVGDFPRPAEVIANRFAGDSKCYVAEVKDRFAGYLWLAFNAYEEDEVRCRFEMLEPGISVWDYDVYVAPEFRLGRTFVRLWDAANHDLAQRGVRWTFSRISAFNAGSMGAHRRMGMAPLFIATFVCLGRVQLSLFGVAPFIHIGWNDGQRPVLELRVPKHA